MAQEIIYTMKSVGKVFPPQRHVLKNISLSYFYGAKIGVLGLNGSGKSTLLKIMAGEEEDFMGVRDHVAVAARVVLMKDPNGFLNAWDIAPAAYAQAHYMMKARKEESNESN